MAAAASSSKRPWQEEGNQITNIDAAEPSREGSESERASTFRPSSEGLSKRDQPAAHKPSFLGVLKNEASRSARQSAFYDLINGSDERNATAGSSPTLASKRVRLDPSLVDNGTFKEQVSATRPMTQYHPHRPTGAGGFLEPRVTDSAPHDVRTRGDRFLSLVGPRPYEPTLPAAQRSRDATTPADNRSVIREDAVRTCPVCEKAHSLAPQIAKGLESLHKQLKHVLERGRSVSTSETVPSPECTIQNTTDKLIETLDYSIDKLNENVKVAKEMLYNLSLDDRSPSDGFGNHTPYGEKQMARWEQTERLSARSSHASPRSSSENLRQQDYPAFVGRDERTQAGYYGHGAHRPSSPSRVLPSPPNITFKTSAGILSPMSPSVIGSNGQSPHTAHLQDLQHQLSTKSLAHQILQGEHEKLLSAYSRSQSRCASLDKKSQLSDAEINNLSDDRLRLQTLVETLEQQIEELQQSRDEAHKLSMASGSQYMQIMAMSSRLQEKGAVELKKYKADREDWSKEKDDLLARITSLENSAGQLPKHDLDHQAQTSDEQTQSEEAELSAMSFERLKEEITSLRRGKRDAESLIRAFKDEGSVIRKLTEELTGAGERLAKIDPKESVGAE